MSNFHLTANKHECTCLSDMIKGKKEVVGIESLSTGSWGRRSTTVPQPMHARDLLELSFHLRWRKARRGCPRHLARTWQFLHRPAEAKWNQLPVWSWFEPIFSSPSCAQALNVKPGRAQAWENFPRACFEPELFTNKNAKIQVWAYFEPYRSMGSSSLEPGAYLRWAKNWAGPMSPSPGSFHLYSRPDWDLGHYVILWSVDWSRVNWESVS